MTEPIHGCGGRRRAADARRGYSPALESVQECPYPHFEAMRAQEEPYRIPGTDRYVLTRYEDVVFAARHPELFANRKYWQSDDDTELAAIVAEQRFPIVPALVDNDPPSHTVYRRIASRAFTPGRLRDVAPSVHDTCDQLIDAFVADREVELVSQFCRPLPMRVACDLLGLPPEMGDRINLWSDRRLPGARGASANPRAGARGTAPGGRAQQLHRAAAREPPRGRAWRRDHRADRATTPEGRELDLAEPSAIVRNLLTAAGETSAFILVNAMAQLLELPRPDGQGACRSGADPRMIEESLRRETPEGWNWRRVARDVEVGGTWIPAGAWLHVVCAAANRDPDMFVAPACFCVHRENIAKQLAFGLGTHFCLGATLARMEGRISFECLLGRLREIDIADRPDAAVRRLRATTRSLSELHLIFVSA